MASRSTGPDAASTVPTPVPPKPAPIDIIQRYLLWHATSTCHARCTLCREAIAYLDGQRALPIGIGVLLFPHHQGTGT